MRLARRGLALGAFCILAACSGADSDKGEQVSSSGQDSAVQYLTGVLNGEVRSPAVAALGESLVVIGGVGGEPGWASFAVVVNASGPVRTIQLPTALADATAAPLGESILIAGRACDDAPVLTDTGVACEGGRSAAYVVDPATGIVADVDLPEMPADPDGSTMFLNALSLGSKGVLTYREQSHFKVLVVDNGEAVAIADPGLDGGVCSGGHTLYAYQLDTAGLPDIGGGEIIDPKAFEDARTTVTAAYLSKDSEVWTAVPAGPDQASSGGVTAECAGDTLMLVASDQNGDGSITSFSETSGRWETASLPRPTMGATLYGAQDVARLLVGPVAGQPFVLENAGNLAVAEDVPVEGWGEAEVATILAPTRNGHFLQLTSEMTVREVA